MRFNKDEILEILQQRFKMLFSKKDVELKSNSSSLPQSFFENYWLLEKEPKSFLVNSFASIGLVDPFQNDEGNRISDGENFIREGETKWVYPTSRMEQG